jgi:hypothetical protein
MDWRVALLRACSARRLALVSLFVLAFLISGAVGLVLEFDKSCKNINIRFWLLTMMIRVGLRFVLYLIIEGITRRYLRWGLNVPALLKLMDLLDLFGMIWFAVGVLLIVNNTVCIYEIPVIFVVSLVYICASLLSVILPLLLKFTLGACPPRSEEDRALAQRWGEYLPPRFLGHENNMASPDLSDEQKAYWTQWLQERGCEEHVYQPRQHPSLPSEESAANNPSESLPGPLSLSMVVNNEGSSTREYNEEYSTCSICLQPYESAAEVNNVDASPSTQERSYQTLQSNSSIVVSYPCSAKHIFHPDCLKSWLQVSSIRSGERGITCPCCRQHPLAPVTRV